MLEAHTLHCVKKTIQHTAAHEITFRPFASPGLSTFLLRHHVIINIAGSRGSLFLDGLPTTVIVRGVEIPSPIIVLLWLAIRIVLVFSNIVFALGETLLVPGEKLLDGEAPSKKAAVSPLYLSMP